MMGRTHLAIGLLIALLLLPLLNPSSLWLYLGLVLLGALLPDVDHEGSMINHFLPITRWVPFFFKHRGFFHSLFPPIIMAGIALWYGAPAIGLYLCIGYLSHLLSDAMTRSGVRFLHPLSDIKLSGFVSTGGIIEWIVFIGVVLLTVAVGKYWAF